MRFLHRAARAGLALCAFAAPSALVPARAQPASDTVAFYFAAHEDDWQLFMNPSAFQDVLGRSRKTVFVHMTAGDAGLGTGTGGRKHPLYLARENGAEAAIRFMADSAGAALRESGHVEINGHSLYRVSYRNAVSYFMRVPDGNGDGAGFPGTDFQSLKRLAGGEIRTLTAVDGSTVYRGWQDLVATVRAILEHERGGAPAVQLHVAETDTRLNPDDHSDHLMTAQAALDASQGIGCAERIHYVDYASARLPENLSLELRDMESVVFAVTLSGVQALDHSTAWQRYKHSFVGRNYFRVEKAQGRCGGGGKEWAKAKP
ncbi:MAG TPA: hypothetical protein VFQ27_09185 [Xanthobacteraceae bacterium]|nr:hypothetical protein [Xanthobacteraceae bacterium]